MKILRDIQFFGPGKYSIKEISEKDFFDTIKNINIVESVEAYVGTRARHIIKKKTGADLVSCEKDIVMQDCEQALIIKMNFRAKVKNDKLYLPEFTYYSMIFKKEEKK